MDLQREIRYYANIPKVLLLLLGGFAFAFLGWFILKRGAIGFDLLMSWIVLVFGSLGVLVSFVWLLLTIVMRKPILRINGAGITSTPPIQLWRSRFVPWEDVERISISVQRLSARKTNYHLLVEARHPERYTSPKKQRLATRLYPSLARVAIAVLLGWIFLRVSRKRRAQLLERIETTFAPEIIQYNVHVDRKERPI